MYDREYQAMAQYSMMTKRIHRAAGRRNALMKHMPIAISMMTDAMIRTGLNMSFVWRQKPLIVSYTIRGGLHLNGGRPGWDSHEKASADE